MIFFRLGEAFTLSKNTPFDFSCILLLESVFFKKKYVYNIGIAVYRRGSNFVEDQYIDPCLKMEKKDSASLYDQLLSLQNVLNSSIYMVGFQAVGFITNLKHLSCVKLYVPQNIYCIFHLQSSYDPQMII